MPPKASAKTAAAKKPAAAAAKKPVAAAAAKPSPTAAAPVPSLAAPPAAPKEAMSSFDAGRLFERYRGSASDGGGGGGGGVSRENFVRMVQELKILAPPPVTEAVPTPRTDFEAGRYFERYDTNRSNRIERDEFRSLLFAFLQERGLPLPRSRAEEDALFDQHDRDRAGALTLDQVRHLFADLRSRFGANATTAAGLYRSPSLGPWALPSLSSSGPTGAGSMPATFGSGDYIYGSAPSRAADPSHAPWPSTSLMGMSSPYAAVAGGSRRPSRDMGATTSASSSALAGAGGPMSPHASMAMVASGSHLLPSPMAAHSLSEAFHARLSSLSAVHAQLMSKRERMVHMLARLSAQGEEVGSARRAIERETLADCEAVLHRLRSAEALKLSLLEHDAARLRSDIEAVDHFTTKLLGTVPESLPGDRPPASLPHDLAAVDPARALNFMRMYPELCADADRLLARPIKTDVDVRADDFERETATRVAVVRRHQALLDLISAKDAIIHMLLREREAAAASAGAAAVTSAEDMRSWIGLAERLAAELQAVRADSESPASAAEAARIVDAQARALAQATAAAAAATTAATTTAPSDATRAAPMPPHDADQPSKAVQELANDDDA